MICEDVRDYMLDFMDNELPATLQVEVDRHLRSCADCREELEGYRKMQMIVQLRAVPEPPLEFWDQAWERIRNRSRASVLPIHANKVLNYSKELPKRFDWRIMAAAAAVTFLIITGTFTALTTDEPIDEKSTYSQNVKPQDSTEQRLKISSGVNYPDQMAFRADTEMPEQLRKQIELIAITRVTTGSIDPISKNSMLVKLEGYPK